MTTPRNSIIKTLDEEMQRDPTVFVIGEEVGSTGGSSGCTRGLLDKYGFHRVLDTPISEIGFTGLAVGAAFAGLRPVVDFMTWNFSLQAIDHIVNSAAKTCYMSGSRIHCPIVFRGPAGFNPGYGAQHVQEFFSVYGAIPGLHVVAPYTAQEHRSLLRSAIRNDNPVVFLENEVLYDVEFEEQEDVEMRLDQARVLQEGTEITIVSVSLSLRVVEQAVKGVAGVEVINLVSLNPIDYTTILKSVGKTGRLVVVDSSWPNYSVAHEISAVVNERLYGELKGRVISLTGKATHVGYSRGLEGLFYVSVDDVVGAVRELVK